jgi:AcrR family transcriptional regulator
MGKQPDEKHDADPSETTRDRILRVATRVFAEHGFRDATTRMICHEAKVNGALVNYYFHSKGNLYKEVVVHLFAQHTAELRESFPVTDEKSWRQAICTWVHRALALCAAEQPPLSYLARLMGREASLPTEISQDFEDQLIQPLREKFSSLLRMGMAKDDPVEVSLWFSALHAQWVIYAVIKPEWRKYYCPPDMAPEVWLEKVAGHICSEIFAQLSYQGNRA